jgi:SAM-dependent methyltransferase
MLYQHPLAYLIGLEGVALLRAFAGEENRDFVEVRLAEVRQLLDAPELQGEGVAIPPIPTTEGYRSWVATYDQPGNALLDVEQPLVWEILDELPVGRALDAACGTGRHTAHLAELGHDVVGVDTSPDMLAAARQRLPAGRFVHGDLHHLPLPDATIDLVVCALALTHVPDLGLALAELARVLVPGGHVMLSDSAGLAAGLRPPIVMADVDGQPGYLPHHNRRASEYLKAALPLGFEVRRCEELRVPEPYVDPGYHPSIQEMLPPGPPNIWWLHHWVPAATNAAFRDTPFGIVWHFQLSRLRRVPSGSSKRASINRR